MNSQEKREHKLAEEEYTKNPLDAVGNTITIGNSYGFTQSSNGISTANIGIVEKFTKTGRVSMRLFQKRVGVYNTLPDLQELGNDPVRVSVKAIHVFPVDIVKNYQGVN